MFGKLASNKLYIEKPSIKFMKPNLPLPKDYDYNATLEKLDESEIKARVMLDIFKKLKIRKQKNPDKCPWCNK
jgi:hypothetical protein